LARPTRARTHHHPDREGHLDAVPGLQRELSSMRVRVDSASLLPSAIPVSRGRHADAYPRGRVPRVHRRQAAPDADARDLGVFLVPLIPTNGRRPLLGGPPPLGAGPPGPSTLPGPPSVDPSLAGGGPPPGLGGPPPGLLGGPLAGPGGIGGAQYPTTDPSQVAGLLGPLSAAQAQDAAANSQDFQSQQMEATVLALIDQMKNQPNPAAQAAMTEPGYPNPPPPAGAM
jgi:hypothetical protein